MDMPLPSAIQGGYSNGMAVAAFVDTSPFIQADALRIHL
jgi:hypothetical protein